MTWNLIPGPLPDDRPTMVTATDPPARIVSWQMLPDAGPGALACSVCPINTMDNPERDT